MITKRYYTIIFIQISNSCRSTYPITVRKKYSFFGVPALLGILAFLVMLMARALHRGLLPEALFVAGLLFCFFWEDAASKRFIWAAVGMAAASVASCGATGHRHIAAGTEEGTGQVA